MHDTDTFATQTGDLEIDVAGLTRVEGEGSLRLRVRDGVVEEAHLEIFEAPRYFERLVAVDARRGHRHRRASYGICPVAYQMTASRVRARPRVDPRCPGPRRLLYWARDRAALRLSLHLPDSWLCERDRARRRPVGCRRGSLKKAGNEVVDSSAAGRSIRCRSRVLGLPTTEVAALSIPRARAQGVALGPGRPRGRSGHARSFGSPPRRPAPSERVPDERGGTSRATDRHRGRVVATGFRERQCRGHGTQHGSGRSSGPRGTRDHPRRGSGHPSPRRRARTGFRRHPDQPYAASPGRSSRRRAVKPRSRRRLRAAGRGGALGAGSAEAAGRPKPRAADLPLYDLDDRDSRHARIVRRRANQAAIGTSPSALG
jgi:hypothetical protein